MLRIKNENAQTVIDNFNKREKRRRDILKNCDGCIHLEILVPNPTEEQFENWELEIGDEDMGFTALSQQATVYAEVVFLNQLEGLIRQFKQDHPEAVLGHMMSMFKNSSILDEKEAEDMIKKHKKDK